MEVEVRAKIKREIGHDMKPPWGSVKKLVLMVFVNLGKEVATKLALKLYPKSMKNQRKR